MKIFIILIALGLGVFLRAEEKPAVPTMPEEITLTSGRVLKKVSVVRWEKERVVLKYAGGVDPIAFSLVTEPLRSQLPAIRDEDLKRNKVAAEKKAKAEADYAAEKVTYSGQLFITTRGAGSYKFGGRTIVVLPPEAAEELDSRMTPTKHLPKPLLRVKTDADGKFTFRLQRTLAFVLFAQADRYVMGNTDYYQWEMPSTKIEDPENIALGWPKVYRNGELPAVTFEE